MSALLTHIQRENWQFFGSMTWRTCHLSSEGVRRKVQFEFLRKIASMSGVPWHQLRWVIREEFGEHGDRLHWHYLLTGLPPGMVRSSTCMFLMGFYEGIGGGMARIRTYDSKLSAASYMLKGLDTGGANSYETGKFGFEASDGSVMLIPARSLFSQWKRELEPNRRQRKARDMRSAARRDHATRGDTKGSVRPAQPRHPADQAGRIFV